MSPLHHIGLLGSYIFIIAFWFAELSAHEVQRAVQKAGGEVSRSVNIEILSAPCEYHTHGNRALLAIVTNSRVLKDGDYETR